MTDEEITAGCVDIDPHTPLMHNRSIRLFGGTVCTHHAIRLNHTEIRCRQRVKDILLKRYIGDELTLREETILAYAYYAAGEQPVRMQVESDTETSN